MKDVAYGDESPGPRFIAYGTILAPTDRRDSIEKDIVRLKINHGLTDDDPLHCRLLFPGDQRKKSAFAKLTIDDVFALYAELMAVTKPRQPCIATGGRFSRLRCAASGPCQI